MNHEKIDVVEVCKELEDLLAPRLKLSVLDRAVYSHLLRHSRFEGKLRLRFSILWLAHNLGITARRARESLPLPAMPRLLASQRIEKRSRRFPPKRPWAGRVG